MSEPHSLAPPEPAEAEASVDIRAGLDEVWAALVTDGGLEPWMGDGATIEPRPNGRLILPDVVGGRPRAGTVDEVEDQRLLRFTWWPITRPSERSTVSITVTPLEGATRVTVREAPLVSTGATDVDKTTAAMMAPHLVTDVSLAAEASAGIGGRFHTGFRVTAVERPAPMQGRSLSGFWAWRLAALTLSCSAVRI